MANRPFPLTKASAKKYFEAAAAAGWGRARLVMHLDGRVEVIAENAEANAIESPLDAWRRSNGES